MAVQIYVNNDSIAASAAVSAGFRLGGIRLVGIFMPAAWDAAAITFQASQDNATWQNLFDENGTEITVQAAASRAIRLPADLVKGWDFLRLRSGTSGVPVNQTAARTIPILAERLF